MRQRPRSSDVMSFKHIFILAVLSRCTFVEAGERWSRQLTEITGGTAPGNDWIPLSRSNERQHAARVLNYFTAPTGPQQQPFLSPDNTAQAQQHHFTFLNHQFPQSNRFVLQQQPQLQELGDHQQFHLSGFNQGTADPSRQTIFHQRTPTFVGQMIQHPPPPPPPPPPQATSSNPFEQQFFSKDPLAETLHTVEEKPKPHVEQPFSYQHIRQPEQDDRQLPHKAVNGLPNSNTGGPISQEEVQLLYVPVETLFTQKSGTHSPSPSVESNRFNSLPQPVSPSLINEFYTAATTITPGANTDRTVSPLRSLPYTVAPTQSSQTLQPSSPVTKPKPNQPPLALFLFNDERHGQLSTNEVLGSLKNINEIAVLDAVSKNSPKVFIGPSGLTPPKSYSRYDLPYLSSVDQSTNRANRKIDEHPFFVAPLSYKTPAGYMKIALPPPHVGSIIVRQSTSSNALDQGSQYTRPTSQSNVQYYTPSTLNFPDTVTKQPPRQVYDAHQYTSPTRKTSPSQGQFSSPTQSQNVSPTLPSRNSPVDEEYFNVAKTKRPTVNPPTQKPNYSPRPYGTGSTRQFDFKPMPEQKIPSFYDASNDGLTTTPTTTTSYFTTTTEKPSTNAHTQFDVERAKTHFREENFRSRRPYQQTSTERYDQTGINMDPAKETDFVHKFKLVDSVRPSHTKSIVDNGYLDFFQTSPRSSPNEEITKTTSTTILPGRGLESQAIRNNYYAAAAAIGEEQGSARQKYVSTYFSPEPSTTTGTVPPPTASTTLTTQDAFFREFEQKSKFYEREPKYEMPYRYETDTFSESHRYSTDVSKPVEPTMVSVEPALGTTADQQQYSIPSELPPISANLPGLVNALMDDPWAVQSKDGRTKSTETSNSSPVATSRGPNFRKQLHRTTSNPLSQESYDSEPLTTTTRRPLQRSRRPHPSRTTTATPEYTGAQTSSSRSPISRSRSRYVPNNDERTASVRTRGRSRLNTQREPNKQEENLDYQRDVLKQNYPVIRPQSSNGLDIAPTVLTTIAPTTLSYKDTSEAGDLGDRLISTTLANEVPLGIEPVTRKYSVQLSEQPYESEVILTTGQPLQTTAFFSQTDEHLKEEVVPSHDVIPLDRNIEPHHSVIPLRSKQPSSTEPTVHQPLYQTVTEIENKITETTDLPRHENMELKKIETTLRSGRRPSLVSRQQQNLQSSRTTSEQPATVRTTTTTEETPRAAGRRPAFVRRPSRLYATTTIPPATTQTLPTEPNNEQPTQGSYSLRTKNRQDILRGRTRRPTTSTAEPPIAATTVSADLTTRGFGRGSNQRRGSSSVRTRQEPTVAPTTQQTPSSSGPRFRIRERTRFTLQPQESQWSARLNQNSFQPVLKSGEARSTDPKVENASQEPETEIVTAAQDSDDVYLVNVSSNYKQTAREEAEFSEDSTEKSVSSFADLLNDVMKDFIQDNKENGRVLPKSQSFPLLEESNQKEFGEEPSRPSGVRNNFLRKRKQSKVVDSFETAESQHINHAAQVLNSPTHMKDSLKNIDHAGLSAKNGHHLYGNQKAYEQPEVEENNAHEETTTDSTKDRFEEEVMGIVFESNDTLGDSVNFTTSLPAEELSTMISVDQTTTTSLPILQESATKGVTTISASNENTNLLPDNKTAQASGIFDDVKKKISDLYEMADNDSDTEEEIDGVQMGTVGEQGEDVAEDMYNEPTDDPTIQEVKDGDGGDINDAEDADMASSETQFESIVADLGVAETPKVDPMGSLVIPTSVSSGITHDTEICYRGRCIKTDKKDKTR